MSDRVELERELTKIWESILGKRGIGVRDNFWEMGGQSLTALRLIRRIERTMGQTLPVSALLQVPTIEEMARLMSRAQTSTNWASLVPIQLGGSRPPFFCVHAMGGLVVGFRHLARALGPEQPFYGLQLQGLDGKRPALNRVEDMAAQYLSEIRDVQPHGPYCLGGLCFGGWIAYEMAQQLSAQGQQVGLLALFDAYTGDQSRRALMWKLLRYPSREGAAFVWQRMSSHWRDARANLQRRLLPRAVKQARKGLQLAAGKYSPRPYSGRVTLFCPAVKSVRASDNLRQAWSRLALGGLEVHEVPGNHEGLFAEPQVKVLAKQLRSCLNEAQKQASEHFEQPA